MLMVISPAKTLDYESPLATQKTTQPDFLDDACELVDQLKDLEPHDISNLMGISDKLGQLNAERFRTWHTPFTPDNARQAVLAFKGDVYTGLDAESFSEKEFEIAQKRLRILSGLYGVLKPLDLMQPYRLEMGTKFENRRGKDLYAFWGSKVTDELNRLLKAGDGVLVNLASNEYFKSVRKKDLEGRLVTRLERARHDDEAATLAVGRRREVQLGRNKVDGLPRGLVHEFVFAHLLAGPATTAA